MFFKVLIDDPRSFLKLELRKLNIFEAIYFSRIRVGVGKYLITLHPAAFLDEV